MAGGTGQERQREMVSVDLNGCQTVLARVARPLSGERGAGRGGWS